MYWLVDYMIRLPDTKPTALGYWIVKGSMINNFPRNIKLFVFILELPDIIAKGRLQKKVIFITLGSDPP